MKRDIIINQFVIKFANINGTGSASANNLFSRGIFRMGVPISPKNIFPSNIQGLPTWYEVRVSEQGFLGRRGGVDIIVSMNPQSMERDLKEVDKGGYFIYDSTKPLDPSLFRDDIDIQFITRVYFKGMVGIKDIETFPTEMFSMNYLLQNYLEYHVRGIATEKGIQTLEKTKNQYN